MGVDSTNLEKKSHASNNNHMEEYRNKVVNLHAILSYDYRQIGNVSKTTSEFTSKSGSRRFYLGNSSSFGGSELLMLLDRCC